MNQKFILELIKLALSNDKEEENKLQDIGNISLVGDYVIVRTYSAGVWAGILREKVKNEVYLANARRLYRWSNIEGISLSGVSLNGLKTEESKVCVAVDIVWLEAIEIIPCSDKAKQSIISQPINK